MKKLESKEDYEALNALPQAILFVDALWSGVSRRGRNIVEGWEKEDSTLYGLQIHSANCDGESYLKWLSKLEPPPNEVMWHQLTVGGYGTVAWLEYGSIISITSGNVHPAMVPELSARTSELFGSDEN